MSLTVLILTVILLGGSCGALLLWGALRARNMHYWIGSYAGQSLQRRVWTPDENVDVFIAICDHWEPRCYGASDEQALERVRRWRKDYPELIAGLHDCSGHLPKYTFFFPEDEYRPEYLDEIRPLVEAKIADVDVHLHHHDDTPAHLFDTLSAFRDTLYYRHGLLRRNPLTGQIQYGFIHGNWALCNSRPDGKLCGVDAELTILQETGCYADFTLPSAPSATQTRTINSIYYARDLPGCRKSHDTGVLARVGQAAPPGHLLMIQGPLQLDWARRRWGMIPRIENADLHGGRGPNMERLKLWMQAGVHVTGRPEWRFIKLHTHGCKDDNIDTLLGAPMREFYEQLRQLHRQHPNFRYHFVSAWEMAQLVHQAESGAMQPNLTGTALV
jgi:hypothetical protein